MYVAGFIDTGVHCVCDDHMYQYLAALQYGRDNIYQTEVQI